MHTGAPLEASPTHLTFNQAFILHYLPIELPKDPYTFTISISLNNDTAKQTFQLQSFTNGLLTSKDLSFTLPLHKTRVSLKLQLITDESTQLSDTLEHLLPQTELLDQHLQRLWDLQYLRSSFGSHGDDH